MATLASYIPPRSLGFRSIRIRVGTPAQVVLLVVLAWAVLRPLGFLFWGAIRSDSPGAPGADYSLEPLAAIYGGLLGGGRFAEAVATSAWIAATVAALAILAGVSLTWLVDRTDLPGRQYIKFALLVPTFYSSLVDVIGWSVLAAPRSGLLNQVWDGLTGRGTIVDVYTLPGIIFVMVIHFIPYVVLLTSGPMQSMNATLEEAAEIAGGSRPAILRTITIPILFPAIAAAGLWVFILAMEMFAIPVILGSRVRVTTVAGEIYLYARGYQPNLPLAAAAGSFLLGVSVIVLLLYRRLTRWVDRYVTVSGKGFRPATVPLGRLRPAALLMALVVVLFMMVLPLGAVVLRSLMPVRTTRVDPAALGLANYHELLNSSYLLQAATNSALLSFGGAAACVALGGLVAYWRVRRSSPAAAASDYILSTTAALPGILIGLGFLWAYVATPLYLTLWLLLLVLVARYVGLGIRGISAAVMQTDRALDEAATVAGASEAMVLRTITFPLLRPTGVAVGFLLFLSIARELSASVLLFGVGTYTLPLLTWEYLTDGVFGAASALAVVQVMAIALLMFAFQLVVRQNLAALTERR
jgi:iron(III) transport system permease protein